MNIPSVGDLAGSYQLRRDTARIQADLARLTRELSSGVTADLVDRLKGNFTPLAGIEQGLARMGSYRAVIAEQRLVTASVQNTLETLRELGRISGPLLTVSESADPTLAFNAGVDALSRFASAIGNLNTQTGGRTILAGVQTDGPALADADTILTALEAEIALAGAVTATDIATVVATWFAPGGGYDTTGYLGGAAMAGGPRISDGEVAPPPPTAQHGALREALSAMATGALIGRGVLSADSVEQGRLALIAGERLVAADTALVGLQASVGIAEAQVRRAGVEVATEADGLQLARAELIEADPYEAAVALQTAETRLQTVYAITARLSRLSLTEYL